MITLSRFFAHLNKKKILTEINFITIYFYEILQNNKICI